LDSNGRLHNATGYEVNWWSNDSLAKFEHEAQCFINEYAKYEITNNQGTKDPVDAQVSVQQTKLEKKKS
jgi:predicted metalloendopeptidase